MTATNQEAIIWVHFKGGKKKEAKESEAIRICESNPSAVYWMRMFTQKNLSEDFMIKFSHHIPWALISSNKKLSEDFIRRFKDKLDWTKISYHQKLSEDF